ncbi:hypothetical protein IID24_03330 [Patescibacteria group bacterium]|nr:hypothetical protein [Patescibacteria group bacterium]
MNVKEQARQVREIKEWIEEELNSAGIDPKGLLPGLEAMLGVALLEARWAGREEFVKSDDYSKDLREACNGGLHIAATKVGGMRILKTSESSWSVEEKTRNKILTKAQAAIRVEAEK